MSLGLPWSRQGHPTIAHRFIGGFRFASRTQPREGRVNSPIGGPQESVTRRVSEGRAQRGVPPTSVNGGLLLGIELSQPIERRTPSLTRRVTGSVDALNREITRIFPVNDTAPPLGECTREGRQKTTPLPDVSFIDLNTSRGILPSLTGLIGSAALTPTVETVGYGRVSLAGQYRGDPVMRSHAC